MTNEARVRAAIDELVEAILQATTPPPAPPAEPLELLSVSEFARRAGIGRSSCWLAIQDGSIRSIKIGGRRLCPSSEIERIAASSKPRKPKP